MTDVWTDKLSDYLNGDLSRADVAALEDHLARCEECRATVAELRHVIAWAGSHQGRPPEVDAWPAIAKTIHAGGRQRAGFRKASPGRRAPWFPVTVPQAVAAGISLVTVAAGTWWVARQTASPPVSAVAAQAPPPGPSPASALMAAQKYGAAIGELEQVLLRGGGLDTSTVRIVREKLTLIDRAIDEARAALAEDPNNRYLTAHFAGMMRRKLALLRTVARS